MCGIFALLRCDEDVDEVLDLTGHINMIQHRGPDSTTVVQHGDHILGFHRLAINGMDAASGQPLYLGSLALICNGEIYNYKELIEEHGIQYQTGSDCEIILHLYKRYGIEETLKLLRGVFAFVLCDRDHVYVARDPYGVRSMYYGTKGVSDTDIGVGICSEAKGLTGLFSNVTQFPSGFYGVYDGDLDLHQYYTFTATVQDNVDITKIQQLLTQSVRRRMLCDRTCEDGTPSIAAYLSGGLDSSIIAAMVQDMYPGQLETYSIGFKGSPDLHYARIVADYIGSRHHEYIVTEEFALSQIPDTIRQMETFDVTSIRAGTFMYMLSKYINEHSDAKVVFSGEGSDEASGSYLYFRNAPDGEAFQAECLRLLRDIRWFDGLRADKCSAGCGLEIREPFLDVDFLGYYMTLPWSCKYNGIEKYILREAVSGMKDKVGRPLLPECILRRPKEAMSNGVSLQSRDWATIIQESLGCDYRGELEYYRRVFNTLYPHTGTMTPYQWRPKWSQLEDPSARALPLYNLD